jgi:ABC-type uncharacterized transport system substrate-binding protein
MAMSLHWRAFASILAGLAMWPLAAHGQQSGNIPRVGIVWIAPQSVIAPFHEAFRQGLRDLGYVEGQTIVIEPRFADGKVEVLPAIAEELVRLKVDAIVAPSTASVRFLKQATTTIPIVMANVSDPVGFGFVASLQGPGTNITGFSNLMIEQVGKNVELSKELVPGLSRPCLRRRRSGLRRQGRCWPTARTRPTCFGAPPITSTRSSRERNRPIFRFSSRPNSSSVSI